ncbi:NUDIX domain-containing protein [Streptomyces longispororuber]|uniref:NUDIX domain-containing protein n=1 Tax=Streptomyces longispororuber TaxID=68230 RepID=UPI002108811A|nr:NUDIX domain-containing protein [Streptomyces longispororuber]MCQ4206463.1 NUDIX domain-containing protein [Streptomyces longispororuber]
MTEPAQRFRSIVDVLGVLQRPDGRVLLVRRSPKQEYAPGQLTLPGGHLEYGESVATGVLRELREEIDVDIDEADLEFCGLIHYGGGAGGRLGTVFTSRQWQGEPFNAEPDKHTGLVWAVPNQPPPDCHPYTTAVLHAFCTGTLYTPVNWPRQAREVGP